MPFPPSTITKASFIADYMLELAPAADIYASDAETFSSLALSVHKVLFADGHPDIAARLAIFGGDMPPVATIRQAVMDRSACAPFWLATRHARLNPAPAPLDPDLAPEQMALDELPDADESWDVLHAAALLRSDMATMAER